MPNGRCRMHGGNAAVGPALPQYKHGRYSKYMPGRLLERAEEMLADENLLELRDEIVLVDARISDVLQQVDTGEGGALWRGVTEALALWRRKRASGDVQGMTEALAGLEQAIDRGAADYAAWGEVVRLVEQRRKLVDTERRRLEAIQATITVDRAIMFADRLVQSVRQHVTDPAALAAISADIAALIATQPDGPAR